MVPFQQRLQALDPDFATVTGLETLQVNLGDLCNLSCKHCHVEASPSGRRSMELEVMAGVIAFLARHPGLTLDITGGAPEMHPHFRSLVSATREFCAQRILRSNLAIMAEPGWEWLPEFCRDQELSIVASLPCYREENVDAQRGAGVYAQSIAVLKKLNALGYGRALQLDLVYNPGAAFLPGAQEPLAAAYQAELAREHGIVFHRLFTITNAPIGRFKAELEGRGEYHRYLQLLAASFNPRAAGKIMCRTLLSVDWQGIVYNCDFNQVLQLPLLTASGAMVKIATLDGGTIPGRRIRLAQHCYTCTAGEGSSCTGALVA